MAKRDRRQRGRIRNKGHEHHPSHHGAGASPLPVRAEDRDRWHRAAAARRRLGDLRPWQCRRPGRGALSGAQPVADPARPQRAGHGARGDRLRQGDLPPSHDGLHDLDRPRRHQHGDRRGRRPCEPPAAAAAARRRVRQPAARSGAATDRGFRRWHGLGERLLPAGVALFRPADAAGAAHCRPAPQHGRADRSRRMRAGDAGAVPGRADGGVRLSRKLLRRSCLDTAPPAPRCGGSGRSGGARRQGKQAVNHRGWWRAVFAGV